MEAKRYGFKLIRYRDKDGMVSGEDYDTLKDDHAVLSLLAGRMADFMQQQADKQNCVCRFLPFIDEPLPCDTCKLRALLAEWDAAQKQKETQCES